MRFLVKCKDATGDLLDVEVFICNDEYYVKHGLGVSIIDFGGITTGTELEAKLAMKQFCDDVNWEYVGVIHSPKKCGLL